MRKTIPKVDKYGPSDEIISATYNGTKYITKGEPFTIDEIKCLDKINKDDKPKEVVKLV